MCGRGGAHAADVEIDEECARDVAMKSLRLAATLVAVRGTRAYAHARGKSYACAHACARMCLRACALARWAADS
eukprot:1185104-Pleurochrysis_carterae.AAC.1